MSVPIIANRKGFYWEVKAGKRYLWCRCGRSQTQPFCDGSHAGTGFLPIAFKAERDEDVIFCGCKQTGTGPFCDGAHSNLPGGYLTDDPDSAANQLVATVHPGPGSVVPLDGQCYVFSTARAALNRRGAMSYCQVVTPAFGALFQSQFYAKVECGSSPVIAADGRHTVLFLTAGGGQIEIGGRRFAVEPLTGIYIRPEEAYRIHNPAETPIQLFISQGPGAEDLVWLTEMPANFDPQHPQRTASIDPSQRHKMAERYYQMLVNREHGSTVVTQFIGNIPLSKAEPHRHLYEEALIFLNGQGVVWTERTKTDVCAGDVLFLPRKQLHSVQCTTPGGFDIVGVIYPGDNPSINY
ncbi:MAG TPA: CDGSH iron-sulfur domain-containing protein [Steroidobacteraceae bacterium]|jgi:CDGSH-type Zn-finger protein/mannose-6-phosphate isomerase-like protein (cupin superfamily)|nr:CDGSH iron-sulfur domain-containing protein [Steroidobacteraceae bacterium]